MMDPRARSHAVPPQRPKGKRHRQLRWAVAVLLTSAAVASAVLAFIYFRSRPVEYKPGADHPEITRTLQKEIPPEAPTPAFTEVAKEAGLASFRAFAGPRSSQLPEDMGPGAAWGDFDRDGDEDLFLVSAGGALNLAPAERAPSLLYENLGGGRFRLVEEFPETKIVGMGAAWGDYNADGWLDLVVTGYRSLILYRNERGKLVRDSALPDMDGFWAGASWGDYDNDRDLDLYVCGYVQYVEEHAGSAPISQQYGYSVPHTLNPASYRPQRNLLFRNNGDGTFTEVAGNLGVDNPQGRSLGALWHDFDDDGWLDLYVANDISDNVLYWNQGGTFEDISHAAWVADYRGAMGLAAADWDSDGDDDLFVSHWIAQENALYNSLRSEFQKRPSTDPSPADTVSVREGLPRFMDNADAYGLGYIALQFVGWGAEFADFDADGWVDLVVANGSTFETEETPPRLTSQEPFFFWNRHGKHFYNLALANEALSVPRVGRGLALADYDNDGDVDILIVCRQSGAVLLRNEMQRGNWVKIRLRSRGQEDGTKLIAHVGDATLRRTVGSASYLSQSSRVIHFGLGDATRIKRLEVRWLGGETDTHAGLEAGTEWVVTEGDTQIRRSDSAGNPDAVGSGALTAESSPGQDEKARLVKFWAKQRAAMHAMKVEQDISQAIQLFREALKIDSSHEDSRYYLGNCLVLQGDPEGALEHFMELTRISPNGARGYKRWGTVRALYASSHEDLDAAKEALERAVSINPEETGALMVLGEIDLMLGNTDSAEQNLTWVCRSNPRAAGGFFLRGYIAWKRGKDGSASDLLRMTHEVLGDDWKPEGSSSEGDVLQRMHTDITPLSRFWETWKGSSDPVTAYALLDVYLGETTHPSFTKKESRNLP